MCSSVITIRDTSGGLAMLHSKTKTPQQQQQQQQHATENILFVKCIFHRKFFVFHEINWNTIFVLHTNARTHDRPTSFHLMREKDFCSRLLLVAVVVLRELYAFTDWQTQLENPLGHESRLHKVSDPWWCWSDGNEWLPRLFGPAIHIHSMAAVAAVVGYSSWFLKVIKGNFWFVCLFVLSYFRATARHAIT